VTKKNEGMLKAFALQITFNKLFDRLDDVQDKVTAKRKGLIGSSYVYSKEEIEGSLKKSESIIRKLESDVESWLKFKTITGEEIQVYLKSRTKYMARVRTIRKKIDIRPQTWSELIASIFKKLERVAKASFPTAAKLIGMISKELAPPIATKLITYIK